MGEKRGKEMGGYQCVQVWQLRPQACTADLEALVASGLVEMLRWTPGVQQCTLQRVSGEPVCYLLMLTFTSYEAYRYWQQIEEEAPDYWERYASVSAHWEQLTTLLEEYIGERVLDRAF
jgi:hypothetical protein